jgi:hypothetical protein
VSYTDHRKNYVPKLSGTEVYRSYLSLMPNEDDDSDDSESDLVKTDVKKAHIAEERRKILAHFHTLTGNYPLFTFCLYRESRQYLCKGSNHVDVSAASKLLTTT